MSKKNRRRYHRPATKAITEDQTLKTENENAEQRFDALKNFYTILTIGRALAANDGYANSAAYLGEDSPLLSAGTFRRSDLSRQTELLTTMYRESWLAMRIIDMPSEDMTWELV